MKISTDPSATTNYFDAHNNNKPYELSPAFFRPEVLSKYKADREKYTIDEREISCRASWYLRGHDVNKAGQIHVYICYLRMLPYSEQLYWQSFNEEPKAGISARALKTDFNGEFAYCTPREAMMTIVQRWHNHAVKWWTLKDPTLMDRANIPLTSSKDEWSIAVMDIVQLVVEGFNTKPLRESLKLIDISYTKDDKTLALLEKFLNEVACNNDSYKLDGMREAQKIRSKVGGHANGSEAQQIADSAIEQHKSFKGHFENLCKRIAY